MAPAVLEQAGRCLLVAWEIQAALRGIDVSEVLENIRRGSLGAEMRDQRSDGFEGYISMSVLGERVDVCRAVIRAVTLERSSMRICPAAPGIE